MKEQLWNREYLTSLRVKHLSGKDKQETYPSEGDILLIKGDEKNRRKWKLGKVTKLIRGKDQVMVREFLFRQSMEYLRDRLNWCTHWSYSATTPNPRPRSK